MSRGGLGISSTLSRYDNMIMVRKYRTQGKAKNFRLLRLLLYAVGHGVLGVAAGPSVGFCSKSVIECEICHF